jgi:RimJ/RimL family protein N-acetyltransferase
VRVTTERLWLDEVSPAGVQWLTTEGAVAPDAECAWAEGYPLEGTRAAARMTLRQIRDGSYRAPFGMFQIVLRQSPIGALVIGDIGFHGAPGPDGSVEIGYGIVEQFRWRGLVGEAAIAMVDWALTQPGVRLIRAETLVDHVASGGVLRHAGFREVEVVGDRRLFVFDPDERVVPRPDG